MYLSSQYIRVHTTLCYILRHPLRSVVDDQAKLVAAEKDLVDTQGLLKQANRHNSELASKMADYEEIKKNLAEASKLYAQCQRQRETTDVKLARSIKECNQLKKDLKKLEQHRQQPIIRMEQLSKQLEELTVRLGFSNYSGSLRDIWY